MVIVTALWSCATLGLAAVGDFYLASQGATQTDGYVRAAIEVLLTWPCSSCCTTPSAVFLPDRADATALVDVRTAFAADTLRVHLPRVALGVGAIGGLFQLSAGTFGAVRLAGVGRAPGDHADTGGDPAAATRLGLVGLGLPDRSGVGPDDREKVLAYLADRYAALRDPDQASVSKSAT